MKFSPEKLPDLESTEMVGPYHFMQCLDEAAECSTSLGYDARLLRRVWLRQQAVTAEVPPARRQVNRVGRLRWLNGFRNGKSGWDAFEAVEGRSLLSVIQQQQEWSDVRAWLLDLAVELEAATQDGSLPDVVSLKNVWITSEGRLKLLDFDAPGAAFVARSNSVRPKLDEEFASQADGFTRAFLLHFANESLHLTDGKPSDASALPLHATKFLGSLQERNTPDENQPNAESAFRSELQRICRLPSAVTKTKKWVMLATALVLPAMMFLMGLMMKPIMQFSLKQNQGIALNMRLERLKASPANLSRTEFESLGIFIADYFGDFVRDGNRWQAPDVLRSFNRPQYADLRKHIEKATKQYGDASEQARDDAAETWRSHLFLLKGPVTEKTANTKITSDLISLAQQLKDGQSERLEKIYIANEYGEMILNEESWQNATVAPNRNMAEQIVAEYSNAPEMDVAEARRVFEGTSPIPTDIFDGDPIFSLVLGSGTFIYLVGIPAIVAGLLFRGGLLMAVFQVVAGDEKRTTSHAAPDGLACDPLDATGCRTAIWLNPTHDVHQNIRCRYDRTSLVRLWIGTRFGECPDRVDAPAETRPARSAVRHVSRAEVEYAAVGRAQGVQR